MLSATMLDNTFTQHQKKTSKKNYFITRVSSKQAQKCLQCNGPKIWNEIPLQGKEMNICKFKIESKGNYLVPIIIYRLGGELREVPVTDKTLSVKKFVYCSK